MDGGSESKCTCEADALRLADGDCCGPRPDERVVAHAPRQDVDRQLTQLRDYLIAELTGNA